MKVSDILIDLLTPEQKAKAMKVMERDAQQKLYHCQMYYEQNVEPNNANEFFAELVDNAKWEMFLPEEYNKLKNLQHVEKQTA
jgi:hypothetical protein